MYVFLCPFAGNNSKEFCYVKTGNTSLQSHRQKQRQYTEYESVYYYLKNNYSSLSIYEMAYETLFEEDLNLRFLVQDVPESRDEVDSISKHVVNLESGSAVYLPKYSLDSENRAFKQEARRLRTVGNLCFYISIQFWLYILTPVVDTNLQQSD